MRRQEAATEAGGHVSPVAAMAVRRAAFAATWFRARDPRPGATSTAHRTDVAPARWPALRGHPCPTALRPLPSTG